ncbi:hypothetical protein diail_8557 [Diaporthe ilicicola]|nr:hypothetical protein diail_8557 [Diaporthe ilicicola]
MSALRSLRDCRGDLHEDSLREALRDISLPGCKSTISVQITKQNAGLIIRRVEDGAVFEMFELSPNNSSVLTTRGRLIRLFPAVAVKVHSDVLVDPEFQSSIAKTMAKMSHQRVPETVPKVRKAKQSHEEERETASSKAVTELLASILLGFGEKTSVQAIRKHTREEVLWKNSKLPWRRSPTWLLVRVTLQLSLQRLASSDKETYKKFMVYFLAHVLEAARAQSLDSDILHTMSAKIVRRLSKLRHSDSGPWMAPIRRAMEQTSQLLDERWRSIRQTVETPIDLSVLSRLDPDRDVHLHLPALDDFLFSILRRTKSSDHEDVFPESQIQSLSRSSLPCITSGFSHEYKPFQLAAIESWVEMDLDAWVPDNTEGPETCDRLAEFLVEYHKHAADCYAGSPEDISRMLLTILEIWIAMDKSAVRIIPLMLQYSPQIPMRLYQGLLLGRMQDMNRLHRAEEYLLSREQSANHLHRPSILSSFGTEGSFSARYFDGSTSHQDLLRRIEAQAAIDKHNKKEEWRSLKAEYYRLMDLHATSICEYYSRTNFYGDTISEHSSSCARCRYSRDAENLSITVHEWPLPMDSFEAKSTVFELDPPPIEKNPEAFVALWSFTVLGAKGLAMTGGLRDEFLEFMGRCRNISYQWVKLLHEKCREADDEEQRGQFRDLMFDIALVCVDSFNVDQAHLKIILDSPDAASTLVEMSIHIRDNVELRKTNQQDPLQSLLFHRWQVLMHRSSPTVKEHTLQHEKEGLDMAIKRCWPAFSRDGDWQSVSSAEYWLESRSSSYQVLYNTLLGELLVGGRPHSRLPASYKQHPLYVPLFGRCAIDVRPPPSGLAGMAFLGQGTFCGHQVHFGMQTIHDGTTEDFELLLATQHQGSTHDLVPSRVFDGGLPEILAKRFVHWYDHGTGEIEFRHLSTPWTTDPGGWRLKKHGDMWTLSTCTGSHLMVSPCSDTARRIAAIFAPLDTVMHMHILYNQQTRQIEIQLPRLKLDFYLHNAREDCHLVRSHQFQGMQIDTDQSIGTLVGLRNKFVLQGSEKSDDRLVLIPERNIRFSRSLSGHVDVSGAYGTASVSPVHCYWIDAQLGRLKDNGTLQSKLFLSYLHALTSHCIPDPFTMHTGTEQALSILESAAVRSSNTLTEDNARLLTQLAQLTPGREFYPSHLKEMQSVTWCDALSYLSQPSQFYTVTQHIIQHVQRVSFLYSNSDETRVEINHAHPDLVEREAIREASLYVAGSLANAFTMKHDKIYDPRDRGQKSERALRATQIATKVSNRSQSLEFSPCGDLVGKLYKFLGDSSGTLPPRQLELHEIDYDSKWLADPEGFLPGLWCTLHHAFGHSTRMSRFQTATWLASLAYSNSECPDVQDITQVAYAFANISHVTAVALPVADEYDLAQGYELDRLLLSSIIRNHEKHYYQSPESNLSRRRGETNREWHIRREREFRAQMNVALECFKEHLAPQWPCLEPRSTTGTMESTYFNVQGAMTAITSKWRAWYQNLLFRGYLENIVAAMKEAVVNPVNIPNFQPPAEPPVLQHQQARVTVDDIFQFHGPLSTTVSRPALDITLRTVKERRNGHELNEVLDCLGAKVCSEYQSRYLEDLRSSNLSLNEEERREVLDRPLLSLRTLLVKYQRQCVIRAEQIYEFMVQDTGHAVLAAESDLGTSSVLEEMQAIAHFAGWWPRTSRSFFLSQLQRVRWTRLPEVWKRRVIEYGLAITDLQRADRLLHACGNEADLVKEICNVGHQNWDPFSSPEWLLMECESGILIRHVQQSIAQLMMVPPNSENATMQLNMGEGKSSVIVPMIAAALADGSRLVRVIVTKPQFKQMHQILVLKLAGMLGRRIYHLPISRNIRLDGSEVSKIWRIILECQKYGGVLLVQPEHLLSFQLMGLEQQISMSNGIGHKLLRIQTWLDNNSRDIIDESDENFSVKFELVYTIGQQRPIEHSPKRWTIIQQVLGLVKEISHEISKQSPKSVELSGHGETSRFPRIRILDAFGSEELLKRLAERICSEGLDGFPISRQPEGRRRAVQRYISKSLLSEAEINAVEKSAFWRDSVINTLLMLRGLVAQGIIAFSLGQKRWRVNYGIDYNRDPRTRLAVPFRAKDDPAPRAEFSHPDVAIVLTCLSYYYSGLNIEELLESFERLKQDDQAQSEYSLWTATASHLPPAFRELVGINLRDKVQFSTEVFPHLRYSKGAIDYFLSKTVFAREMKEFPKKLSTSGWDLAKIKKHPTTGFSGTNDSRYILPLNVTQLDQAEQRHTNALVLCYLLQPENSTFLVPKHDFTSEADVSDGKTFLQTVSNFDQETRVILDVGAQLIDLTNRQVSEAWLEVTQHRSGAAEAVIFFDEEDVLSVLDRSGHSQPFQTSHHAHQTDKCLVFLDEAHTRGTDLKLPEKYRAAVTLGANLTKDRLLQACMRMRRLGHGQSVVFCVPQEIKNKIIQLNNDNVRDYSKVTVSDVVKWAISETTDDTRKSIPLWITQALRFGKHSELWRQYSAGPVEDLTRWSKDFREDEAQSLEQRYRPSIVRGNPLETNLDVEESFKQRISDHCRIFGPINFHAADLQEEQERELSPEAEEERQVERPPAAEPERHKIHENVQHFVQHGYFQDGNRGIRSAFSTLDTTSAAKHLDPKEFPAHLWVTGDFARTVKLDFSSEDQSDFFQRSVSWILTSTKRAGELFIISPYEAQQLLPAIKSSNYVTLHLYAPRMNMGQQPLDHLALYTVPERRVAALPPMLSSLLNVFAGQLYMRSFEEYTSICKLLGLAWQSVGDIEIEADGFIPRRGATTAQLINQTQFTRSPTKFLQDFMTKVRRNNESIEKTHMGRLLNGEILCRDGFKLGTGANQPGVESLSAEVSRLKIVTLE